MYNVDFKSLTGEDQDKVKREIISIYSRYNIETTIKIEENSRLKTTAGRFFVTRFAESLTGTPVIQMNPKYYREFGIDRFIGTVRHEMAHFIQYLARGYTGHNREFKQICADLGGTMNQKMAADTCPDNGTKAYLKSDDKWEYKCPGCNLRIRTKKRLKMNNRGCRHCRTPIRQFTLEKIV